MHFSNLPGISVIKTLVHAGILLCLTAGSANAAQLRGTVKTAEPTYNLTTLGTLDWAHWGLGGTYGAFDHKSSGGSQISDVTPIGSGQQGYSGTDVPRGASWTDGTPTQTASDEKGYLYTGELDSGWSFTVPADTTTRTLYVYLGGWGTHGKLTANLSDGSMPDYEQTVSGPANYQNVVAITYQAASTAQVLTISFVMTAGNPDNSLDLKAAWLTLDYPPAITEPLDGAIQTAPASFTISAAAGAKTAQVDFFAGTNLIGSATTSPYTITWKSVAAGKYALTARVKDNAGVVSTTEPVNVAVYNTGGSLQGLEETASPDGYDLTALGTADWAHWGRAGGMNFDHKVIRRGQISDVTLIGSGHNSFNGGSNPRAASWSDGTPTESISGEAGYYYTEALQSGWSFTIPADTVSRTLYVYCGGWGVFHTLSAHLSDWSSPDYVNVYQHGQNYQNVYQIDYKAASANQTLTVTLLKTGNEPGGNGSVDLKAAWLVGGAGHVLPTVKITEPAPDASFGAPASIKLTADATANEGTITKVEFFSGTNLIGSATASPYTFTWGNVPVGRYSFTAKVTDNTGASSLSTSVSVAVTAGSGGNLKGSFVTADPAGYDLTALGSADWAHWGREGGLNFDHKTTGQGQISDVALIGTGHNSYNGGSNPRAATWTDGTPTESMWGEAGYYYTEALKSGWSLTVPADKTPRKLFIYCGGWGVFQTLQATLSDSSAPEYVATYQHNGNYQNVYEIDYHAGSAGQTLTVTLVKSGNEPGGNGSVDLKAAWLVGDPSVIINSIKTTGSRLTLSIMGSKPTSTVVVRETGSVTAPQWTDVQNVTLTTEPDGRVTASFAAPSNAVRFYQVLLR